MIIFKKKYNDESTYDLPEDVGEALEEDYNSKVKKIPKDENGFRLGTFTVTIEWENK